MGKVGARRVEWGRILADVSLGSPWRKKEQLTSLRASPPQPLQPGEAVEMDVSFKQYLSWCKSLDGKFREGWAEEHNPDIESSLPHRPGDVAKWSFSFGPPLREPGPASDPFDAVLLIRPEAFPETADCDGPVDLPQRLLGSRWQEYMRVVAQGGTPFSLIDGVEVEHGAGRTRSDRAPRHSSAFPMLASSRDSTTSDG